MYVIVGFSIGYHTDDDLYTNLCLFNKKENAKKYLKSFELKRPVPGRKYKAIASFCWYDDVYIEEYEPEELEIMD